jgi:hypothetical protein
MIDCLVLFPAGRAIRKRPFTQFSGAMTGYQPNAVAADSNPHRPLRPSRVNWPSGRFQSGAASFSAAVGGGRKSHRSGGRKLHTLASWRLHDPTLTENFALSKIFAHSKFFEYHSLHGGVLPLRVLFNRLILRSGLHRAASGEAADVGINVLPRPHLPVIRVAGDRCSLSQRRLGRLGLRQEIGFVVFAAFQSV